MKTKHFQHCPCCGNLECSRDENHPDQIEYCPECGCVWNIYKKIISDPREVLDEGEILQKGWFIDVNY